MSEREKTIEPCWGQCGITELQARLSAVLEGLRNVEREMQRIVNGQVLYPGVTCVYGPSIAQVEHWLDQLAALRTVHEEKEQ